MFLFAVLRIDPSLNLTRYKRESSVLIELTNGIIVALQGHVRTFQHCKILDCLSASLMFTGFLNQPFPSINYVLTSFYGNFFLEILILFNFGHMHSEKALTNHFLCMRKPKY